MKLTMLNLASKSSVPIFLPTFEINYLNLKNRKKGNELDSPVSNKYLYQIFRNYLIFKNNAAIKHKNIFHADLMQIQ